MKTERYNFYKEIKLQNVCETNKIRPIMECILFDEGNAIASDGHILISCPIELISNLRQIDIDKLNGHLIYKKDFATLVKMSVIKEINENEIIANDKDNEEISIKLIKNNFENYRYPNYKKVLKYFLQIKEGKCDVSLNVKDLVRLCSALNQENPIFHINSHDKAVIVKFRKPYESVKALIVPKCV